MVGWWACMPRKHRFQLSGKLVGFEFPGILDSKNQVTGIQNQQLTICWFQLCLNGQHATIP